MVPLGGARRGTRGLGVEPGRGSEVAVPLAQVRLDRGVPGHRGVDLGERRQPGPRPVGLADRLTQDDAIAAGVNVLTGGTDVHLALVDLAVARDIEAEAGRVPGVQLVDLSLIQRHVPAAPQS